MKVFTYIAGFLFVSMLFLQISSINAQGALLPVDMDYDGDVDGADLAAFTFSESDVTADLIRFSASFGSKETFAFVYEVGPGQTYANPNEVPWESLMPGSLVRIHYQDAHYRSKWVLAAAGTADAPIVVRGIPRNGMLPVISGENATTRMALDFWNENRSVIKIGGSSHPSGVPAWVTIENLDIRSARPAYSFIDDAGNSQIYSSNAAAIHVEQGSHITIRNCVLHDCANGFFAGAASTDLLLESNHISDNGMDGSIYQHNNYTECRGITFQYNHFGPLRSGCRGNNLKDRSAGTLIRYNWIEAGNRTLDLVDSDHSQLIEDPAYAETFVYGNVLIKHDVVENGQVLHYGGDSGYTDRYRKGTLWFFNNTVVSHRSGNTTLMRLSTNEEHAECFNNVVMVAADSGRLAILDDTGSMNLYHNWLSQGWTTAYGTLGGTINSWNNLTALLPGFIDPAANNYHLAQTSDCVDAGSALPADILPDHALLYQYLSDQGYTIREDSNILDIGAFTTEEE